MLRPLLAAARNAARCAIEQPGAAAAAEAPLWPVRHLWTDIRGYQHFEGRGPLISKGNVRRLLGGALLAGGAYYSSCVQEVPYTHRRRAIMFLSPSTELAMGQQLWEHTLREAREAGTLLPPDHSYSRLVASVGRRIAAVACDGEGGGYQEHMKHMDWEYAVINSPMVNAFVVPGGKVVVFTGLLRTMRTEDELAAVLAHESAHIMARHSAENTGRANAGVLALIVFNGLMNFRMPPGLLNVALLLPHSRAAENEADAIGLQLLARACYSPDANVRMLQRLADLERPSKGALLPDSPLLRTHPLSTERVERVRAALPEAYKAFQSRCSAVQDVWQDAARVLR
ncbi:M48 peptidase [Raphidocelis subcapitata]|uniref:M48 peptidase n=1 Tax=Raphidocelis subcapitata TaxID=307507 RepID=A0A2V0NXX2_9CHLO|nr:M48 peptidase [Raphidocelis subcapitata]|eukprot:GBF92474.1 M48 peptidase [Raphidocelis subcapitata]